MAGYLGSTPVPQATQHRESFTATSGQTTFATAGYTAGFVDVYLNGSHLSPADFTATNGSDVVLASGASADDVCDIISYTAFEIADQTFTGTTTMTDVVAASLDISGNIDIDGTTNLDVVDIDGAVNMATTALVTGVLTTTAATVFNGGYASNAASTQSKKLTISNPLANAEGFRVIQTTAARTSGGALGLFYDDVAGTNQTTLSVINNGTGSAFQVSDGGTTVFKIADGGFVTMPLQPAFLAQPSSTQSNIAINSNVTVNFGTERFDVNADFASDVFTAPVAGKYQFNVNVFFLDLDEDANYMELQLVTTNRLYITWMDPDVGTDPVRTTIQVIALADLDAGDTAFVRVAQSAGAAQADIAVESFFSGYLVA